MCVWQGWRRCRQPCRPRGASRWPAPRRSEHCRRLSEACAATLRRPVRSPHTDGCHVASRMPVSNSKLLSYSPAHQSGVAVRELAWAAGARSVASARPVSCATAACSQWDWALRPHGQVGARQGACPQQSRLGRPGRSCKQASGGRWLAGRGHGRNLMGSGGVWSDRPAAPGKEWQCRMAHHHKCYGGGHPVG
jgi:hypothetical protein